MQNKPATVVILGTGGTIAGTAAEPGDNVGYSAAQIGVAQLVAEMPALASASAGALTGAMTEPAIEAEQVAQIDSKDMDFTVWRRLAERVSHHLARAQVQGIVITHGTDTLEETAYFLQRVLAPRKPVVLAAAMRPATSLLADGPQNLLDAVGLARLGGAQGVMAVLAGQVHSGLDVRKTHTYRLNAFGSGDAGVLGQIEEGVLRRHRPWPQGEPLGLDRLPIHGADWPRVELLTSHAGAGGALVRALCASGVQGIVVAGTGNGSLHHALEAALVGAQASGVRVWRSSRCGDGVVIERSDEALPGAGALTPVQARIELMLELCAGVD